MKIAINELEHLREEVRSCHRIIKDLQKKREWVGLTHEKTRELVGSYGNDPYNLAYKTEEALREKNT